MTSPTTSPAGAAALPRTGIRSGFTPMESLDQATPDPGFFGPNSISWRVHHDPANIVGGIRALILQALHPDVMRSFHDITSTREDPWGRLARTGKYVNTVTYGTRAEAEAAAARVRFVHHKLGLDRPDWLLWVHCGAVDSWLEGHRRSGAPMTGAEADRYVAEQVEAARLIGCDVQEVPQSVAELAAYFDRMRTQLDVTPETRASVRDLIWPPMAPRVQLLTPARPAWTTVALTGFGLMPRWSRRMFALPGLPTTDLSAGLTARALRTAFLTVPEPRRTNPHLTAARVRLGLAESISAA